jgi:hypothetical protein
MSVQKKEPSKCVIQYSRASPATYSYKTGTRTAEELGFSLHAKYHQHYIKQELTTIISASLC